MIPSDESGQSRHMPGSFNFEGLATRFLMESGINILIVQISASLGPLILIIVYSGVYLVPFAVE